MSVSVLGIYPWHEIPEFFQKWLNDDSKIIIEMDKMTVGFHIELKEFYEKMKPKDVAIVCQKADEHLIPQLPQIEKLSVDSLEWWDFWQEVQGFNGDAPSGECLQVDG